MPTLVALRRPTATALRDALDEVWAAGDAALPIAATLPTAAVDEVVGRLRPGVVDLGDGTAHRDDTAPPVPAGTAVVVTTSGSTGERTGVVLGHDTLAAAVARHRRRLGARDGQPWLGVLPLHHVAGISVLLRARAAGVEPALHDRDDPAVVDDAPPSWISLVPTQLDRLLAAGVDLARHLGVLLGGAAASPRLLAAARAAGVAVTTSYGMTETCGGCVYDGVPLDDVEVRAADDGRLWIRGPVLADGVRGRGGEHALLPTVDGWFRTGDRGEVDATGRVTVHGRADDVVVSGGENVPLAPVRRALRGLVGVADADVVGLPDDHWGTAVTAVLVPAAGASPTLDDLRDALRDRLPASSLPTRLVVVDALPRDELGKVTPAAVAAAAARAGRRGEDG